MLIEDQAVLDNANKGCNAHPFCFKECRESYDINRNLCSKQTINKTYTEKLTQSASCRKRKRTSNSYSEDNQKSVTQEKDLFSDCKACEKNKKDSENFDRNGNIKSDYIQHHKLKESEVVSHKSVKTSVCENDSDNFWSQWVPKFLQEPEHIMVSSKVKGEIHRHADSLLSTDSGFTNYRGLLNLCILLLALANTRLFLENLLKYGILIDPLRIVQYFISEPYSWPNVLLVLFLNVYIVATYFTEVLLASERLSERAGAFMNVITLSLSLIIPAVVILYRHPNPGFSVVTCGLYTIVFLKLVSYVCVNKWCREKKAEVRKIHRRKSVSISEPRSGGMANGNVETFYIHYPDNLTLHNIYYFMFAPTLCYELNFPRTLRIRKRFLIKRIVEMMFLAQLMMALVQQWIIPTMRNSMKPLTDMEVSRVVERLLKLAVPNHLIWLIFFYWFFHSCLNVSAELLRFGDREFYKDWWNAVSVSEFWQNWNIPVHRWAVRHLYKPLVRRGYSKQLASVAVFAMSAFFHEYLVSVPLRMFRIWAFSGMLGQVPLAMFTAKYMKDRHQMGNMVVWLSLILGQPIAIFAYVHDYYITHADAVVT